MKKTIEQLEGKVWGEPEYASHLVITCHNLRKKPINQFSIEDFRIMIGQDIGTQYLLPAALQMLKSNPLASGDLYDGDLLTVVLELPKDYWQSHQKHLSEALQVAELTLQKLSELNALEEKEDARRREEAFRLYGARLDPDIDPAHPELTKLAQDFLQKYS